MILFGLLVVGFLLGRVQTAARTQGNTDPVTRTVQSLVLVGSRPIAGVWQGTDEFFHGVFSARSLTRENERLRAIEASAALYSEQVERLNAQIVALRKLNGLPTPPGRTKVPADIIGMNLYENRMTLDVGTRDGIKLGMPVVGPDGLIGTIQVVEATRSQALLLTSASMKISAVVGSRNPPPAGFLRGEDGKTLRLTFMDPKANVKVNDRVQTSGFSEQIPAGIPIGEVIQVEDSVEFGTVNAVVYPHVEIGTLKEVVVLR